MTAKRSLSLTPEEEQVLANALTASLGLLTISAIVGGNDPEPIRKDSDIHASCRHCNGRGRLPDVRREVAVAQRLLKRLRYE